MGVSVVNYVVRGVFFTNEDIDKMDIPQEFWEIDQDDGGPIMVNPMVDSSFMIGDMLFCSLDGRYDDNSIIPPVDTTQNLEGPILAYAKMPNWLLGEHLYNRRGKYGTWVFTQVG